MEKQYANLHSMWDKIDLDSKQDQGFQWGQLYLEGIIDELSTLKEKSKKENNPYLYNQLRTSLIRAHEAKNEIDEKIKSLN